MDDLCKKLLMTYDANFLNDAPKELKEAFYKEAVKEPECIKGRKVLMSLIKNYFEQQKPSPAFIGGPKSLTQHRSEFYQKTIYIFGENHSSLMECDERFGKKAKKEKWGAKKMSIEDFLYYLIRTTCTFIDLYIEFPAYKGSGYNRLNFGDPDIRLQKLLERFKKCVEYSKRAADDCRLARVHYFDVRNVKKDGKIIKSSLIDQFESKVSNIMETYPKLEWATNFRKLINENRYIIQIWKGLAEPNDRDFINFLMIYELNLNLFVKKELSKIKDPNLIYNITTFIANEFLEQTKAHRKRWQHNVPIILNSINILDSDDFRKRSRKDNGLIESINDIVNSGSTLTIRCLVADTYLLARVFKDFNMKEIEEKGYKGATDQPDKAHNVIIYAGNAHAEIYRKFLKQLDFKEIAKTGVSSSEFVTCINMKNFKQPFFSRV